MLCLLSLCAVPLQTAGQRGFGFVLPRGGAEREFRGWAGIWGQQSHNDAIAVVLCKTVALLFPKGRLEMGGCCRDFQPEVFTN